MRDTIGQTISGYRAYEEVPYGRLVRAVIHAGERARERRGGRRERLAAAAV